MATKTSTRYEDNDYMRYYDIYGDEVITAASTTNEWDPDVLLADDEISDAEEGFLNGYEQS